PFGNEVYQASWSPNGRLFAARGNDKVVAWRVEKDGQLNSKPLLEAKAAFSVDPKGSVAVTSLAWRSDSSSLAVGSKEGGKGKVLVWRFEDGQVKSEAPLPANRPVTAACWCPLGRYLAAGGEDGKVTVWPVTGQEVEVKKPRPVATLGDWVTCLSWSPDGRFLAAGGRDGKVTVCSPEGARARLPEQTIGDYALSLTLSPDARFLAAGGWKNPAEGGRAVGEGPVERSPLNPSPGGLIFSPDGKPLALKGGRLVRWRAPFASPAPDDIPLATASPTVVAAVGSGLAVASR